MNKDELDIKDLEFIKMLVDYEIRNQQYTYMQKGKLNKLRKKLVKKLTIPIVSNSIATEYAEFCVRCDREKLPLLCLEDYIKQYCC